MTSSPTSSSREVASRTEDDASEYWAHFGLDPDAAAPPPAPPVPEPDDEPDGGPGDAVRGEDDATAAGGATETVPEGSSGDDEPRGLPGFGRAVIALMSAVVVLGIVLAFVAPGLVSAQQDDARREEVAEVTRQMMTNLVTLRFDSAQGDVDRLLDGATGSFREQFGGQAGAFRGVLEQGRVVSTGQVTEVGVQDATEQSATALAAVRARVANSDSPDGQERNYRMRVTLQHQDDRWLVADVEFVP